LRLRARVALAEGAGEEEAGILEELVALDPLDGEAMIHLGRHFGRQKKYERAHAYFQRAAAIGDAYEAEAKLRDAQLLVSQGRYSEAVPLLRRSHDLEPSENLETYLRQVERLAQGR
jgi:tetratricopeptide (TPR) repeat protein